VQRAPVGFDPQYLLKFQDKLFIEGPATERRLVNFYALLILATIIATYGVISDSPATVIGAMIVAPLMQPIMATTAAVAMGSFGRALRALALVASGILIVILLSALLTWLLPDILVSFETNNEMASRISPGLMALFTALASGAAGAFIATREEIADSLAGVAIAISLVPPLCVVGIAITEADWVAAFGALLLFTTNFMAILLSGGIVFLVLGLGALASSARDRATRRNGLILIIIATLFVALPLTVTSTQVLQSALDNRVAADTTRLWLDGSPAELEKVTVAGDEVNIYIIGAAPATSLQQLADNMAKAFNRSVVVNLRQVPSETIRTASSQAE
jgi:uncharacterized hydrophobic protein (TIGR00271 family)